MAGLTGPAGCGSQIVLGAEVTPFGARKRASDGYTRRDDEEAGVQSLDEATCVRRRNDREAGPKDGTRAGAGGNAATPKTTCALI